MAHHLDAELLANAPIGQGLEKFCEYFRDACTLLGLPLIPESIVQIVQESSVGNIDAQRLLFDFADCLGSLYVIWVLPSILGGFNLREDLYTALPKLIRGELDLASIFGLCQRIIFSAPDYEIWSALYDLLTPRPPLESTTMDCSVDDCAGDRELRKEVEGHVYLDVKGYYAKYYDGKPWTAAAERAARAANRTRYWTTYPDASGRSNFLSWFRVLQFTYFPVGRGVFCPTSSLSSAALQRLEGKEPPDLFLVDSDIPDRGGYTWENVWVFGKISNNDHATRSDLLGLYTIAREVFFSQPTRPFLHAFLINGCTVQMWVYDRSGPYCAAKFSLTEDSGQFVKILTSFTMMSNEELGVDTYIKEDDDGRYIVLKEEGQNQEVKLRLDSTPITTARHSIVSRGTTCYRAKRQGSQDWEFVAKFCWRPDAIDKEDKLLRLAQERGVWGVSQLFGLETITSTQTLRRGLVFGSPGGLKPTIAKTISLTEPIPKNDDDQSSGSGLRRKRKKGITLAIRQPKKTKTKATIPTLTTDTEEPYANRTLCCLVISPPGRRLQQFESTLELLMVFRDVVKAHRSLFLTGGILHQDISDGNIIITRRPKEGDPVGTLIDLDMSCEVDEDLYGQKFRTGTLEFMAIGVLQAEDHMYHHDLESIFYVFLWIIITEGGGIMPLKSKLRGWYRGTYEEIRRKKEKTVGLEGFEKVLKEFPSRFQALRPLALDLRRALFPYPNCPLAFSGARQYFGPEKVYDRMLVPLEKAIEDEEDRIEWEAEGSDGDGVEVGLAPLDH